MQALVFCLVASAFTVVYITQPVLPILETEFGVEARTASLSVSAVIFGIALANLPFGILADRYPVKPLLLIGGTIIAVTSLVCAMTHQFTLLILARSLPSIRLNVVMGSYVAATVAGGLGGRLLGGWIHPPAALAVRVCQRRRAGGHGDCRRLSLAPR
jgi:YNFM family putative membrane transporter